jgi:hypothetical protein
MKRFITKRTLVASLLGLTAFGAVFGSAATLGGITPDKLGADAEVIGSCDSDGVSLSYDRAYDASAPAGYKVTAVTVAGVNDDCDGQKVSVTLTDSADNLLSDGSETMPTAAGVFSHRIPVTPLKSAEEVTNAHVVISP